MPSVTLYFRSMTRCSTSRASQSNFRVKLNIRIARSTAYSRVAELNTRSLRPISGPTDHGHTYGTHAYMSVLVSRSYPIMRISRSSETHRSSGRPRHQGCGTVQCVSRQSRNGGASNHPHPTRQSHTRGPRKDGFQAIMAAATRREQKVAAPSRHSREPSRSWPQHGARDGSSSRQSKGVAATRRPPLASSMSRRQPQNLPRDGEIRSHRSAKVARRVRACSNRLLGRTRSAHRPGSDQVASTSTCGVRCLLAASSCAQ